EDGTVNADEAANGVTIDGTSEPGSEIVVTIGDEEFPATTDENGNWAVDVPAEIWEGIADGELPVNVEATDAAGNTGGVDDSVTLDTTAPVVTIDPVSGDGVINAAEHGEDLPISGTATDLVGGEEVTVEVNGKTYTTTADADGSWSVDVPAADVAAMADGDYIVTANVTDTAGNTGEA